MRACSISTDGWMITPPAEHVATLGARGDFGDAYHPFIGPLDFVVPFYLAWTLGQQLIAQRRGVVIIHQPEDIAHGQRIKTRKDGGVALARTDVPNIQGNGESVGHDNIPFIQAHEASCMDTVR